LKVEATAVNAVYRPGEDARIRFHVTNSRGEGVQAALGLQVVDEAVFALAEKQPGFAKVFFYLEQEVLKPRYEIHSIGMQEIAETVDEAQVKQRDRAARALFSATEMVTPNKFETEFGRSIPATKSGEYAQRYQKLFLAQVKHLAEGLDRAYQQHPDEKDLMKVAAKISPVHDPWNTNLKIEPVTWAQPRLYYLVQSAGPDKQFNTGDEMGVYLEVHHKKLVGRPSSGQNKIDVAIEHDRGAFNGRAEVEGTVIDQAGGALEGATVTVQEVSTHASRQARVSADGKFRLSALLPGEYQITASTSKETVSTKVKLEARDHAVLSVFFRHEATETVVTVN
jgi:hypothetical protein